MILLQSPRVQLRGLICFAVCLAGSCLWMYIQSNQWVHLTFRREKLSSGLFKWQQSDTISSVTPEAVYNTEPRKLLAWCMLDTPVEQQEFLSDLANEYGTLREDPWRWRVNKRTRPGSCSARLASWCGRGEIATCVRQ